MEEKKTRKFKFTKLVRDNIVDQIEKNGGKAYYTDLDTDDFVHELKLKLLEETMEVPESTREELIQELADIQEVIDNLVEALEVDKEDLKVIQEKKREKV